MTEFGHSHTVKYHSEAKVIFQVSSTLPEPSRLHEEALCSYQA